MATVLAGEQRNLAPLEKKRALGTTSGEKGVKVLGRPKPKNAVHCFSSNPKLNKKTVDSKKLIVTLCDSPNEASNRLGSKVDGSFVLQRSFTI